MWRRLIAASRLEHGRSARLSYVTASMQGTRLYRSQRALHDMISLSYYIESLSRLLICVYIEEESTKAVAVFPYADRVSFSSRGSDSLSSSLRQQDSYGVSALNATSNQMFDLYMMHITVYILILHSMHHTLRV